MKGATCSISLDTSALDSTFKAHAHRGIGRYVRNLDSWLGGGTGQGAARDLGLKLGRFDHRDFIRDTLVDQCINNLPVGRHTARQQLLYPLRLAYSVTKDADILHFPAHMDAPSWCPKPYLLTVLDLIPLKFETLYLQDKPSWRFRFARWLEVKAIRNAKLILAISEATARDVQEILGIPSDRIVVTPLGVDQRFHDMRTTLISPVAIQQFRARHAIGTESPIVLYVGGIDQRKNWPVLLSAFGILNEMRRAHHLPPATLCLAGKIEGDLQYPKLQLAVRELGIGDFVRTLGFVPDEELGLVYSTSSAFFFPSLYEGFGLPPLEALAAGVPVVSSNTSSLPEVLGKAALLSEPSNARGFAEQLFLVLSTPQMAAELRELGIRQAQHFTWEKTGRKTLEAYDIASRRLH